MLDLINRTSLIVLMSACVAVAASAAENDDSTIWEKVPIPAQVEAFEG